MSGTSQATAFVTGTAALLASQTRHWPSTITRSSIGFEGARAMKGNEHHTLLSAGIISVPQSLQVAHDELKKGPTTPEVALGTRNSRKN